MGFIAFMTDWGYTHYVAQAKAVVYRVYPQAEIIDITHNIPHFDIRAGMHVLYRIHKDFPDGSVFLAVVDPGVGTQRRAILGKFGKYYFVAPDNGIMSMILRDYPDAEVYSIENRKYFYLKEPTYTFHGRDIFAPAAAHILAGVPLDEFGPKVDDPVMLDVFKPKWDGRHLKVEVAYVDDFGNVQLYLKDLPWDEKQYPQVWVRGFRAKLVKAYGDVPAGTMIFHRESSGFWELAVSGGNAGEALRVKSGDIIEIIPVD
ncbi:SAM hydrolase/SAM-dependent halogenase family protein [Zhurongbacter thermophilus]